MKNYKWICDPIKINETFIKNRIVVPPMADFGMTEEDGCVNERHLQHYGAFAWSKKGYNNFENYRALIQEKYEELVESVDNECKDFGEYREYFMGKDVK